MYIDPDSDYGDSESELDPQYLEWEKGNLCGSEETHFPFPQFGEDPEAMYRNGDDDNTIHDDNLIIEPMDNQYDNDRAGSSYANSMRREFGDDVGKSDSFPVQRKAKHVPPKIDEESEKMYIDIDDADYESIESKLATLYNNVVSSNEIRSDDCCNEKSTAHDFRNDNGKSDSFPVSK
ncbi:hypothetical protein Bhyg_07991, partial [Pseudolycoriella hygida]